MLFLLSACAGTTAPAPVPAPVVAPAQLRFEAAAPVSGPDGTVLAQGRLGDQVVPLTWTVLLRQDEAIGAGAPFGTVLDDAGAPLQVSKAGTCRGPDYNGLFSAFGRTWLFTHLECTPAGLVLSELERVPGGAFKVRSSAPTTGLPPSGLNQLCSGDMTPWGTLLSGEEYETNVPLLVDGDVPSLVPGKADGKQYNDWGRYAVARRYVSTGAPPSPYAYGWMAETSLLDATGQTRTVKRTAMGRFSHELGAVMPDGRTVYMTDDGTEGILAMFVADREGDLSAGTLYASRWTASGNGFKLGWVSLGHATEAEINAAIEQNIGFDAMFDRTIPEGGACPEGYTPHRNPQAVDECLRFKAGMETLTSRLETRRWAALRGATTEITKEEGVVADVANRRLYVATTRVVDSMLAGDPPWPGRDHLALTENNCGAVWELQLTQGQLDADGQAIDSPWVAADARIAVAGVPEGEGCAESSFSEPDNLAFIDGQGVLLIAEDTDRVPNRLWAYADGRLTPIFAAPSNGKDGGEVSGLSWVSDVDGAGWITMSLQHPPDRPAVSGVLGPFPAGLK